MRILPPRSSTFTVAQWLADAPHAFSRAELLSHWSRWDVDCAARAGAIARIAPAVYAAPQHLSLPIVRGEAVGLWHPGALVTGELALSIYEPELPAPPVTDVVLPYGDHARAPQGMRILQRAPLHTHSLPDAVACSVPERALLDAWHLADPRRRTSLFYETLWAKVTTARAVARELEKMPRLRDRRALERLLAHFASGATSPVEVFARTEVFVGPQWRAFEWQMPLPVPGRNYVGDMVHPVAKVVVELDGRRYHGSAERAERDRIRDAELASRGYVTVRLSPRDLADGPQWCIAMMRAAVASRLL